MKLSYNMNSGFMNSIIKWRDELCKALCQVIGELCVVGC